MSIMSGCVYVPEMIMSILTQEFERFFHMADTDEDGYLSLEELTTCLRKHGYKGTDEDIQVIGSFFLS